MRQALYRMLLGKGALLNDGDIPIVPRVWPAQREAAAVQRLRVSGMTTELVS